jgi:outer membrane receptor protein involved in Fe transport
VFGVPFDTRYRSRFETYTAELNQIFQTEKHTLVLGGRYQNGVFTTTDMLALNAGVPSAATNNFPSVSDDTRVDFERASVYGYYTWEIIPDLLLTGGAAYDHLAFPLNFRSPPVSGADTSRDQFNPKAALVWTVVPGLTLRGIYSRSLGGVSFDESFRLEPTQLAGFEQAFRTIINESLAGSVSAPDHRVIGAALDFKAPTHTYLGIQGELLRSRVDTELGAFDYNAATGRAVEAGTPERLDYHEGSVAATLNQLVGDYWSFGLQYRVTRSELHTLLPQIPPSVLAYADRAEIATLHQLTAQVLFSLPCGFFSKGQAAFYGQDSGGYLAPPGDSTTQLDFFVGWRFRRLRGEVVLGVLNLLDENYRLNPLNTYSELPRERVYTARLKLNF